MSLIRLEKQFTGIGEVKNKLFTQVKRNEKIALYEVSEDNFIYYELIVIKVNAVCLDFEKRLYSEVDFKESYPKSNQWGINGFTYKTLETALKKFDILNETIEG